MFTATAFALTVHYNLPNSLAPVRNKKSIKKIVLATILTAMAFYWLIGAFCAVFFQRFLLFFFKKTIFTYHFFTRQTKPQNHNKTNQPHIIFTQKN